MYTNQKNISDTPKVWTEERENDTETSPIENLPDTFEEPAVPELTHEEKMKLVDEAPEDYKSMLGSLVEVSEMANTLQQLDTEESQAARARMLDLVAENFIRKRMNTNQKLEDMKLDLISRVWHNIDQLDLQTAFEMAARIHEMTAIDGQKPLGAYSNPTLMPTGDNSGPAVNLTINNATGQDSQITQNTLSVGNKPPVSDLKTVSKMSETIKAWGNIPKKSDPIIINTEATSKTE